MKPKLLAILGPTATGKSAFAVSIAKKFNGEIISADSRQVYKGLDLGTGKITGSEMKGIQHHLLDVANPKKVYSVVRYIVQTREVISAITKRGKLPIMCGGTGFYIQSVIDNISFPNVPRSNALRKTLGRKSAPGLFLILEKLDPKRAGEIDPHNKVRLIRAIEIAKKLGRVPEIKKSSPFDVLQIGIDLPDKILKENIKKRLTNRLRQGMINEVGDLHKNGLSWERMEELGLEYRYISHYLQEKITEEEMKEKILKESWQYVRRQRTWFKKDKRIKWFNPSDKSSIEKEVLGFFYCIH